MPHPHPHAASPEARRCDCGALVFANSFRTRLSYREFHISGLCQACQDPVYLGLSDVEPLRYALRRGAVVVCIPCGGTHELVVVPFVFTAPRRPLAWEARYITRVAPAGAPPVDPYAELHAMRDVLRDHQVRVHSVDSVAHPLLTQWFGRCELLIGLDTPALERVAALCPALAGAAQAPIAVPFERRYGALAMSLGDAVASLRLDSPRPAPSALRLCAWLAVLLTGPSPSAPALFPEVLLSRPDVLAQCPPWRMDAEPAPTWVSERPRWRGYVE